MKKEILISLLIGIVVIGTSVTIAFSQPRRTVQKNSSPSPIIMVSKQKSMMMPRSITPIYTLTQVAEHLNATSCWTAINGDVYDLTSWIMEHPGGEGAILSICGKDGSAAFNGQHGDQGQPEQILATFKIGTLVQ